MILSSLTSVIIIVQVGIILKRKDVCDRYCRLRGNIISGLVSKLSKRQSK